MVDIADILEQLAAHKTVDFAAVKCAGGDVAFSVYSDGNRERDEAALEYLKRDRALSFLQEKDILFYTVQTSPKVWRCYEYRPVPIAPGSEAFRRLVSPWDASESRRLIDYFAAPQSHCGMVSGGIYCFGVEYPKGREDRPENAVWKIYFRTYFMDDEGARIYRDKQWMQLVSGSACPPLMRLAQFAAPLLSDGFSLHMVGWNYDRLTGACDYKLYFFRDLPAFPQASVRYLIESGACSAGVAEIFADARFSEKLALEGLAVSCSGEEGRVNFYFKERIR